MSKQKKYIKEAESYVELYVPIYGQNVHVFFGVKSLNSVGLALFNNRKVISNRVFFREANPSVGTLAHEMLHVANNILLNAGVECSLSNDEAQAYLLDHLIHELTIKRSRL